MHFIFWNFGKVDSSLLRNLFSILFRPQKTVDRLLEERKFGQSWGATWFLIGINLLVMVLLGVWLTGEISDFSSLLDPADEGIVDASVIALIWGVGGVISLISIVLSFILSRFFFKWLVVLGIRMVASREYPTDPAERREKGRLVELIQPYTMWIYVVASLVSVLFLPLVFDMSSFVEMIEMTEMGGDPGTDSVMMFIGLFIWSAIVQLIALGLFIYMIIVRVFALKKIYNISAAKAFFGPFITYLIVYVVFFILYILFVATVAMIPAILDPSMV